VGGRRGAGLTFVLLLVAAVLPAFMVIQTSEPAKAGWWNANWQYRRAITIIGSHPENYQLRIILPFFDNSIRFLEDEDSGLLPYWVESYTSTSMAVWVKRFKANDGTDNTIYVYYGNPSATRQDNFSGVFSFGQILTLSSGGIPWAEFAPVDPKRTWLFISLNNDTRSDQECPVYDVSTGTKVGSAYSYRGKWGSWSGSANYVAVGQGGNNTTNRVYRTTDWSQVASVDGQAYDSHPSFKGEDYLVSVYNNNGSIGIWRMSDWTKVRAISGSGRWRMNFSPDYSKAALWWGDNLTIWDTSSSDPNNWSIIRTITGSGGISSWSPDGNELAVTVGQNSTSLVRIYNTADWSLKREISLPSSVYSCAVDVGLIFYAVSSNNKQVFIYSKAGELLKTITYSYNVTSVDFDLVSQYLAVSTDQPRTYVYEVRKYVSPEPIVGFLPLAVNLLTEGQVNPTQIATYTPRFTVTCLVLDNALKGENLQIQVSTNGSFSPVLWDRVENYSPPKENNQTATITYSGPTLSRGTTYYWRARWYSRGCAGCWSSTATFRIADLQISSVTADSSLIDRKKDWNGKDSVTLTIRLRSETGVENCRLWIRDGVDTVRVDNLRLTDRTVLDSENVQYTYVYNPADDLPDGSLGPFDVKVVAEDNLGSRLADWTQMFTVDDIRVTSSLMDNTPIYRIELSGTASRVYGSGTTLDNAVVVDNNEGWIQASFTSTSFSRTYGLVSPVRLHHGDRGQLYALVRDDTLDGASPILTYQVEGDNASITNIAVLSRSQIKFNVNWDSDGAGVTGTVRLDDDPQVQGSVSSGMGYMDVSNARSGNHILILLDSADRPLWNQSSTTFYLPPTITLENLKTDGMTNPTKLADTTPTFSWDYSDSLGKAQQKYQVWVGLSQGSSDTWNSGEVSSSSHSATYAGPTLERGRVYYVQVRVYNGTEWSGWVTGFFKLNTLPTARNPRAENQTNPTRLTTPSPTLSWEYSDAEGDSQAQYQIQVTTDPSFGSITHWDQVGTSGAASATYAGQPLSRGVTYYWRVRVKDTTEYAGENAWGDWATGTFRLNQPPSLYDLRTEGQADPTRVTTLTPTFSWTYSDTDGDGQVKCQVRVGTSPGDNSLWDYTATRALASMTYSGLPLQRGENYCVSVRVFDGYEWSDWASGTFRINRPPRAENQRAEGEVNPTRLTTLTPTLGWSYCDPDGDAQTKVRIQVGTSENGSSMWDATAISSSPSIVYGGAPLQRGVTYYWRVQVFDGYEWSDWLWGGTFRINRQPLAENQRAGGMVNPTKLPTLAPVLGWSYSDPDGDAQAQKQIQVGTSENAADVWDYTASGPGTSVTYAGPQLQRGVTYHWRVRVYDYEWGPWLYGGTFRINELPACDNLRAGGEENPTHLTSEVPVLSWRFLDNEGDPQSDYQVQVGSAPDTWDMWDSGQVAGSQASVTYAGKKLSRGTTYYWRVRVRDGLEWGDWCRGAFRLNQLPVAEGLWAELPAAPYTGSENVALRVQASDQDGAVALMGLSLDNRSWGWIPYSGSTVFTIRDAEGVQQTIYLKVRDDSGEESNVLAVKVILDKTPPRNLYPVSPVGNAVVGPAAVRLDWTPAEDNISGLVAEYVVQIGRKPDLSDAVENRTPYTYLSIPYENQTGDFYWRVRVRDRVGNESSTPILRFTYNPSAPAVESGPLPDFTNSTALLLPLKGANASKIRYSLDDQAGLQLAEWGDFRGNLLLTLEPAEGTHTVYYELMSPGGVRAGPFAYTFVLDLTPPQLQLPRAEVFTRENTVTIGIRGFDAVSGVEAMRVWRENENGENAPWEDFSEEVSLDLPDQEGTYRVNLQLRDRAGNLSAVRTLTVTVDRTPPVPEVQVPERATSRKLVLSGRVEPGAKLWINGEGVPVAPDGTFSAAVRLGEGRNSIQLYAKDPAGNEYSRTYEVLCTPPGGLGLLPLALLPALAGAGAGAAVVIRRRGERPERKVMKEARKGIVIKTELPPSEEEILREAERRRKEHGRKG